jgi:hypothetical protein
MSAPSKVYKTSIVPETGFLQPIRNQDAIASSMQIEVFHVLTFVCVFAFIFAGIWKAAVAVDQREKALSEASQNALAGSKA